MTNIKITVSEVESLIDELAEASQAYLEGRPFLTDEEYDSKQDYLEELSLTDEFGHLFAEGTKGYTVTENEVADGAVIESDDTIIHEVPMLSLKKVKTTEGLRSFVESMLDEGASGFRVQVKLDGFALSAEYNEGKLFQLGTRHRGGEGVDVTYFAHADKAKILGLPLEIEDKRRLTVRGEVYLSAKQFEDANAARLAATGQAFANSRNAVVGLLGRSKSGLDYPVEFSFTAYAAIEGSNPIELSTVADQGFVTVDELTQSLVPELKIHELATVDEVVNAIADFGKARGFGFDAVPTDGAVIKPENEAHMLRSLGSTSHHPVSQAAYKFPTPQVPATVLSVELSVGKTGKVTPRANITPATVLGSTIRWVSLHNFAWMAERGIKVGSNVLVTKADEIIPYIKAVVSNPDDAVDVSIPKNCPACSEVLEHKGDEWPPKTLRCVNMDCPSRDAFALMNAVSTNHLDIDGLSSTTLESLTESGHLNSIADLYSLTQSVLEDSEFGKSTKGASRKLGATRARKILKHIELSKDLPISRVLPALGIQGLGATASKALLVEFPTIDSLLSATPEAIAEVEGFGEVRAKLIVKGLEHRRATIDAMRAAGVKFAPREVSEDANEELVGKSFAISGEVPAPFANRNKWVEYLEDNGAKFHSSPKANTDFMVADADGTSSKVVKAKKLGVTFMAAKDFTSKFVNG